MTKFVREKSVNLKRYYASIKSIFQTIVVVVVVRALKK